MYHIRTSTVQYDVLIRACAVLQRRHKGERAAPELTTVLSDILYVGTHFGTCEGGGGGVGGTGFPLGKQRTRFALFALGFEHALFSMQTPP